MTLQAIQLDHDSPAPPVLTRGARNSAAGVKGPPVQTLGLMTATSSADGSFNDGSGLAQMDCDSSGNLYIGNAENLRLERYRLNTSTGLLEYDSKILTTAIFGSGLRPTLVAIDRSVSPNQLHLGCHDQNQDNTWIGVWSLASWPTLNAGNRLRSYGSNAGGSAAGKAVQGLGLTIDSSVAVVVSNAGDFRLLRWNHLTGALLTEETQGARYNRFARDGANWFGGAPSGSASEPGAWKIDPATFAGVTRLDTASYTGQNHRPNRPASGNGFTDFIAYAGRVYGRESFLGRLLGWDAATLAYLGEFALPGGASSSASQGRWPGYHNQSANALMAKMGVWLAPSADYSDLLLAWSSNADSSSTQSFITCYPLSIATATWSYSGWSAGSPSTLLGLPFAGLYFGAQKVRIKYRKTPSGGSAGAWKTVPLEKLLSASYIAGLGDHQFSQNDLLEVQAEISLWDDLSGFEAAVEQKKAVEDLNGEIRFDDPNATIFTPFATGSWKGRLGGPGRFQGRLGA